MHVALTYNQKKESRSSTINEPVEPPTTSGHTLSPRVNDGLPVVSPDDDYAEWDSIETITAVRTALEEYHSVTMVEADEDAYRKLLATKPDIVFNIAEGLYGVSREAQIPAMLEYLHIPYTGSDPLTLATALDKARTKEILSYNEIPTAKFVVLETINGEIPHGVQLPCIVKPVHEGSSKGVLDVSVVRTHRELSEQVARVVHTYHQPALIEEFLPGQEFTVALLGNDPDVQVLPIVEIKFDALPDGVNRIYSYEAKWIWDQTDHPIDVHECPAKITATLKNEIDAVCRKTYSVMRCRDWCRIDVRLDAGGTPHVIELNPLPGILPDPEEHSCFPQAARTAGMSYNELIQSVLNIAIKRYKITNK
jgi:D-alanine-D-alanine ligase